MYCAYSVQCWWFSIHVNNIVVIHFHLLIHSFTLLVDTFGCVRIPVELWQWFYCSGNGNGNGNGSKPTKVMLDEWIWIRNHFQNHQFHGAADNLITFNSSAIVSYAGTKIKIQFIRLNGFGESTDIQLHLFSIYTLRAPRTRLLSIPIENDRSDEIIRSLYHSNDQLPMFVAQISSIAKRYDNPWIFK